jgi:hypothetical protein
MHRIDGDSHDSNMFTEGNPGLGEQATQVTADWANAVQEEICNAIEIAGGAVLSKPDNTQLSDFLAAMAAKLPTTTYTGYAYASASQFHKEFSGLATCVYTLGNNANAGFVTLHAQGGASPSIECRIACPAGATITAVDINYSVAAPGLASNELEIYTLTKSSTAFTFLAVKDATLAFPTSASPAWLNVASITSRTVPEDGYVNFNLYHPGTDADLKIYAVRITYTLTVFRPAP